MKNRREALFIKWHDSFKMHTHTHADLHAHTDTVWKFSNGNLRMLYFFHRLVGEKLKQKKKNRIHLKYQKFLTSLYIQMNRNRTKRTRTRVSWWTQWKGKEKSIVIEMSERMCDTRTKGKKSVSWKTTSTPFTRILSHLMRHTYIIRTITHAQKAHRKLKLRDTYGRHSTSHYDDDFLDKT